ncbi:MAG: T9SS type A sorting domain-containing protein, partial [bacterium]
NTSSTFPPPSYCWGKVLTDPAGDLMNGVTDSKLDITGQWATYSDTRLYFRISHAGGDWNVGGLWPPYFSWACYVINPDAPTDTIYYALLYCKNVGVIAPGLWRFTRSGSYTQIGSIQNQVVNDSLVLSCSMDTLTSDPYFGPWPNPSGYLIVGVRTDKAVSLTSTVQADRTPNQKFYPSTMTIYPTSPNSPPYIWDYTVTESKLTYSYIITINYRDDDNNLPTIHKVIVNGAEFDMTTSDHRYDDGAVFSSNVMLGSPIMSLGFRFFDGRDSSNSIYLYAEKDELPNNLLFVKAYPNPFNRAVTIEFTANSIKPVYFRVYDITGKMVDYIELNNIKNGKNTFCYTPSEKISSGIYFYRLEGIQKGGRLIYLK